MSGCPVAKRGTDPKGDHPTTATTKGDGGPSSPTTATPALLDLGFWIWDPGFRISELGYKLQACGF